MKRYKMVWYLLLVVLLTSSILVTSCSTGTKSIEETTILFDATVYGAETPFGKVMQWYGNELSQATDNKINFEYAWAFSLSRPGEALDQVASGLSQMAFTVNPYYPKQLLLNNSNFAVFGAPNDIMTSWKVWDQLVYEDVPALGEEFEKYGVKLIYFAVDAPQVLESTTPITSLDDFNGKKIAASGYFLPKFLEAVGATPLPTTVTDRGTSLQTGLLDGSVLPPNVAFPFKLHEFAPNYLEIKLGAWYSEAAFMNLDLFNSFPKGIQDTIMDLGRQASRYYVDIMEEELRMEREARLASGVTYSELSDADLAKWAGMVGNPIAEAVSQGIASGAPEMETLMEKYLELCRKEGHKFPREWSVK